MTMQALENGESDVVFRHISWSKLELEHMLLLTIQVCQISTFLCPMNNVFKFVLEILPLAEFLDQQIGWESTADF